MKAREKLVEHKWMYKNTFRTATETRKIILEITPHPVKVTKNVIRKEVTCRLDLGGALGGQLPKGCRERKWARSFVSFASRSPEVGMMCQLLVMLISGAMVLSPVIVWGEGRKDGF